MQRRGFMHVDAVIALALLATLVLAAAAMAGYHRRAIVRLADARAAVRLAERELLSLQGKGARPSEEEGNVVVRTLPDAGPKGHEWVEVRATVRNSRETLTGLAPTGGGR